MYDGGMNDSVIEAGDNEAGGPDCELAYRFREQLYKVQL